MTNKRSIRFRTIAALFLVFAMFMSCIPAYAASNNVKTDKVLFVTDAQGIADISTFDATRTVNTYSDYANYEDPSFDMDNVIQYRAVAFPYCESLSDEVLEAYNSGCIVYLYGSLTIQEYKAAINLNNYALDVNLYNEQGYSTEKVSQFFDSSYESNEVFNIISYGPKALLCKVAGDTLNEQQNTALTARNYLVPIEKNFSQLNRLNVRNTLIDSDFDIVTTWGPNSEFSITMDYYLYRNYDEVDPDYDYFAVKTRVWIDNDMGSTRRIQTKYELPYSTDNLIETGPDSQSNIGSLSVSVGYGESGPDASIGYSLDLSDSRPTIERTEDYTNDTVEWTMTPRTLFPLSIDGTSLTCCATWASRGTSLAAIDLFYNGIVSIGPSEQYPTTPGYTEVPIRYYY